MTLPADRGLWPFTFLHGANAPAGWYPQHDGTSAGGTARPWTAHSRVPSAADAPLNIVGPLWRRTLGPVLPRVVAPDSGRLRVAPKNPGVALLASFFIPASAACSTARSARASASWSATSVPLLFFLILPLLERVGDLGVGDGRRLPGRAALEPASTESSADVTTIDPAPPAGRRGGGHRGREVPSRRTSSASALRALADAVDYAEDIAPATPGSPRTPTTTSGVLVLERHDDHLLLDVIGVRLGGRAPASAARCWTLRPSARSARSPRGPALHERGDDREPRLLPAAGYVETHREEIGPTTGCSSRSRGPDLGGSHGGHGAAGVHRAAAGGSYDDLLRVAQLSEELGSGRSSVPTTSSAWAPTGSPARRTRGSPLARWPGRPARSGSARS